MLKCSTAFVEAPIERGQCLEVVDCLDRYAIYFYAKRGHMKPHPCLSRAFAWVIISLAFAEGRCALGDTADDLVYSRYNQTVLPGKIHYEFDMKFVELARPATQKDVDAGKAVFTFEGLGSSRVWKLPSTPIFCQWPAFRDHLFPGQSNFDNYGYICQAEEIQVAGHWKRYFGFVSKFGTAVVPARDIYLSLEGRDEPIGWTGLPGGMDWGMLGPNSKLVNGKLVSGAAKPGDALLVELFIRNSRGIAQTTLAHLYRSGPETEPALREGINLFLAYAPFAPRNPDSNYPRTEDFKPVAAFRTNHFSTNDGGGFLETAEKARRAVFDLRDLFKIDADGYYQYHFNFDPARLGLPTNEVYGPQTFMRFTVGLEPKRLTVEELNRDISPFGGTNTQERLRDLILRSERGNETLGGGLPLPERVPVLVRTPDSGDDNPFDIDVVGLWVANRKTLAALTNYDQNQVRLRLESLIQKETSFPMKLLLASEAAPRGSQTAAQFLLANMATTDYEAARNTLMAIHFAMYNWKGKLPDWMVQMAIAALSDERYVTGLQKKGWTSDTQFRMSYLADEDANLTQVLGYLHCTNAVPFLIEMAKKTDGRRGPVMALGTLGDARAIPVLIDLVKQKGPAARQEKGWPLSDGFLRPVEALGNLRASEAVPILLDYIDFPNVIEALQAIGDPSAIGTLNALIAASGRIDNPRTSSDPEFRQRRLVAARIAVAALDPIDRTSKLCELLAEPSFGEFQRRSVVWALASRPDSNAIPFLATAIKSDSSGAVVNQAIQVLPEFKFKASVDVLIDSFDASFQGKHDWKRAYTPEMFRDNLAQSLMQLTGQHIGADKQQWQTWWRSHRDSTPELK
jgi:HEAT repeat protein